MATVQDSSAEISSYLSSEVKFLVQVKKIAKERSMF